MDKDLTGAQLGITGALYDGPESEKILRVGHTSRYKLIDAGLLRPTYVGGRTFHTGPDLVACINALRRASDASKSEAA